jgi:hypothetical protein
MQDVISREEDKAGEPMLAFSSSEGNANKEARQEVSWEILHDQTSSCYTLQ